MWVVGYATVVVVVLLRDVRREGKSSRRGERPSRKGRRRRLRKKQTCRTTS
jgi:hypothetical protein